MKKEFNHQDIMVSLLSEKDWQSYRDFCAAQMGEEHLPQLLSGNDNPENWEIFINESAYKHFGLFHDGQIIGSACILFDDNRAAFTGIMIDEGYRKQGLADHLHDVRKRYLKEIDFTGNVSTKIWDENTASIKAAERNGFQCTGSKQEDGSTCKVFTLTL